MRGRNEYFGDIRTRTFFAFLPVSADNDKEWRWLETVTVEQMLTEAGWQNIKFIDEEE